MQIKGRTFELYEMYDKLIYIYISIKKTNTPPQLKRAS